ncbi:MAG: cation-translocating P-type ATPase [Deltaproteobacteria bacterium]|nr:cation-translocating P-type ATPase [Deltaproteobacteria bacterium]
MEYIPELFQQGKFWVLRFSVGGMKCHACVSKIRHLICQTEPSASTNADFLNQSFTLRFQKKPEHLPTLIRSIRDAGFTVTPFRDLAFRQELLQLGVAAYSAGNIMLMATAEYLHPVDEPFRTLFHISSLVLTAFSVIFAGKSLWDHAWQGILHRKFDIDSGILLGISSGFVYSAVNVIRGSGDLYFDSVSVIILLILVGRFFRNRILAKAADAAEVSLIRDPDFCVRKNRNNNEHESIPVRDVRDGDTLLIRPGDLVPVRSRLIRGRGMVDLSSINGEAEPRSIGEGEEIPSGAFSIDGFLELSSLEDGDRGFFSRASVLSSDLINRRSHWQNQSNRIARIFIHTLLASVILLLFFQVGGSIEESIRRSVALLLVACPCALGFGIPLVYSQAIRKLARNGVIVRDIKGLEQLPVCQDIIFDKTGTLTSQQLKVESVRIHTKRELALAIARSIGDYSQHHVPRLLSEWALGLQESGDNIIPEELQEIFGQGIQAKLRKQTLLFGKRSFACPGCSHEGQIHLSLDGDCLLSFDLSEVVAPDAEDVIRFLQQQSFRLFILSGDLSQRTEQLASKLNVPEERVLSNQSPEDKLRYVRHRNHMMVGNGINDMLAFAGSRVSVAVSGSQELARQKADFSLNQAGLAGLKQIVITGQALQTVFRRLYTVSFVYNICTLSAAVSGYINPLLAAILMPVSSLLTIRVATHWPQSGEDTSCQS